LPPNWAARNKPCQNLNVKERFDAFPENYI